MKFLPGIFLIVAASATPITYVATLSGPAESPPNMSPGSGSAVVIIDTATNTLDIESLTFANLLAGTTASHIHCCTATPLTGTAIVATTTPTFPGFPLGVTSGTYSMSFDLTQSSTYNPAFITAHGGTTAGAEAALAAGLAAGEAYLNIHTTSFPNGEIRGFLVPLVVVPEPETWLFAVVGVGLLAIARIRPRG